MTGYRRNLEVADLNPRNKRNRGDKALIYKVSQMSGLHLQRNEYECHSARHAPTSTDRPVQTSSGSRRNANPYQALGSQIASFHFLCCKSTFIVDPRHGAKLFLVVQPGCCHSQLLADIAITAKQSRPGQTLCSMMLLQAVVVWGFSFVYELGASFLALLTSCQGTAERSGVKSTITFGYCRGLAPNDLVLEV